MTMIALTLCLSVSLFFQTSLSQFTATCNNEENLMTKTCCPNNCGGPTRGMCKSITEEVMAQSEVGNPEVVDILRNTPNVPEKGTADARYLWPSVVFENVCECNKGFGGADCMECDFGWMGDNCDEKKPPVIRRNFASLSQEERQAVADATGELKNEVGVWSVIVEEPANYSASSGRVTLQNVSTYDLFIFLHNYVTRDSLCKSVDRNISIDFAHSGPVFPVWHRRYILIVEKEFQRIMNNPRFGFPYWQWEENDMTPFDPDYYGTPSHVFGPAVNVNGRVINPQDWNTVCDRLYQNPQATCALTWPPCNPANDLAERRPLQRGIKGSVAGSLESYLPNRIEVMIAIAAPSYDAADENGEFFRNDPRTSFRSRLEGWNGICSAVNCVGPPDRLSHMHNVVHDWVGGQMDIPASAINDPIFNFHHCNVDRILESWIQRYAQGNSDIPELLPAYTPVSGGHAGHNRDDYIVPFFPLIKAGKQYSVAENWGYMYDELISADISDSDIPNCSTVVDSVNSCPHCDASGSCLNCTNEMCPGPTPFTPVTGPSAGVISDDDGNSQLALGLGLGLGLGLLLVAALAAIVILGIIVAKSKLQKETTGATLEMSPVKT